LGKIVFAALLTFAATFAHAAEERRLFLVVFDLAFTQKSALLTMRAAMARHVLHENPGELFAIATYSSGGAVELVTPFLFDAAALQRGLARLTATSSSDPLGLVLTDSERSASINWQDLPRPVARKITKSASVAHQLEALAATAERIAPLGGSRHVLLLSGGFPRADRNAIEELAKRFAASQVVLDVIELGNAQTSALPQLASATGGVYVRATNNLEHTLTTLFEKTPRTSAPAAASTDPLALADVVANEIETQGPLPDVETEGELLRVGSPVEGEVWIYAYSLNDVAMKFHRVAMKAGQTIEQTLPDEVAYVRVLLVSGDRQLGLIVLER
jgi:hypothetical protein